MLFLLLLRRRFPLRLALRLASAFLHLPNDRSARVRAIGMLIQYYIFSLIHNFSVRSYSLFPIRSVSLSLVGSVLCSALIK